MENTIIQLCLEEITNYRTYQCLPSAAEVDPFFLHDERVKGGNNLFLARFPPYNYNLKAHSCATLMSSTCIYNDFGSERVTGCRGKSTGCHCG